MAILPEFGGLPVYWARNGGGNKKKPVGNHYGRHGTSNTKKRHEGMSQTQAVPGINSLNWKSLESSVQQNEGARRARKTTRGKVWQAPQLISPT